MIHNMCYEGFCCTILYFTNINQSVSNLVNNIWFTLGCGIATIIGLFMTIYVCAKTKSIHRKIVEIKKVEKYNEERQRFLKIIRGYQEAISKDHVSIYKIRIDILNDMNILKESYQSIMTLIQKIQIRFLIFELEKEDTINENKVLKSMAKIIAMLSTEKENKND